MSSLWKAKCARCDRLIGWRGKFNDKPPCRCGYIESKEILDSLQREMDDEVDIMGELDKELNNAPGNENTM